MLRVTDAFVKKLAAKADDRTILIDDVTVYHFKIHTHSLRVKIVEDDGNAFMFIDYEWIRFIQMYVGMQAENFTFSGAGYHYPLEGTDKEMADQYLAIKALTDHDDRVWGWMDLKPYTYGYYNFNGKEYLYYLNNKTREYWDMNPVPVKRGRDRPSKNK